MKGPTIKIELDPIGYPGHWVEARTDVKVRVQHEYQERIREARAANRQFDEAEMQRFLAHVVSAWTLDDDEGTLLPLPAERPDVWEELPSKLYEYLIERLNDALARGRTQEDAGNSNAPSAG
jgi:hypothetical protein